MFSIQKFNGTKLYSKLSLSPSAEAVNRGYGGSGGNRWNAIQRTQLWALLECYRVEIAYCKVIITTHTHMYVCKCTYICMNV